MDEQRRRMFISRPVVRVGQITTVAVAAILLSLCLAPSPVVGVTWRWTGGGGSDDWTAFGNWEDINGLPHLLPPSDDGTAVVRFGDATRLNSIVDDDDPDKIWRVSEIRFVSDAAGSYTIGGDALEVFGLIENSSDFTQTFDNTVRFLTQTVISPFGAGLLRFNGEVVVPTLTTLRVGYTVLSKGDVEFNGMISGAGTINIEAGGLNNDNLTVFAGSATNTFSGTINVEGNLLLDNSSGDAIGSSVTALNVTINEVSDEFATFGLLQLGASGQIADNLDVTLDHGRFHLNGHGEEIDDLIMTNGFVDMDGGFLAIDDVTVNADLGVSKIKDGNLNLLGGTSIFTVADGNGFSSVADLEVSATIINGSLTKEGDGIMELREVNTYSGTTTINAGVLRLVQGGRLSDSSDVTINSGGELEVGVVDAIDSLNGSGMLQLFTDAEFSVGIDNGDGIFSGMIVGLGKLIKTGSGNLTLSGDNSTSLQSTTLISGGTLIVTSGDNLGNGTVNAGVIFDGGTLEFNVSAGTTETLDSYLAGDGDLTKTGGGTLIVEGKGTTTGVNINVNDGTLETRPLLSEIGDVFVAGTSTFTSTALQLRAGALDGSGAVMIEGSSLSVGNSGAFSGVISGIGAFRVGRMGGFGVTQTLSGASTYTGGTIVNGSTLRVTNASGSATGTGPLRVSSSSTLHVDGGAINADGLNIFGVVEIDAGGRIDVGDALELGAADTLTLWTDGTVNLSGGTIRTSDVVINGGTFDLSGGTIRTSNVVINGGTFEFNSGTLNYTQNLNAAPGDVLSQILGPARTLASGQTLKVDGSMTVAPLTMVTLTGGTLDTGGLTLEGELSLGVSLGTIIGGVEGPVNLIGGSGGGKIKIVADTFGFGIFRFDGPVNHNGDEIRTSFLRTIVFADNVTGAGDFRGDGTICFEADYSPGTSASEVSFDRHLEFGPASKLAIELGGTATGPSAEFDRLLVGDFTTLDGILELSLINNFRHQITSEDEFIVISTGGSLSGDWTNVANGGRLGLTSGTGTFLVSYGANSPFDPMQLVLSDYQLPTNSVAWLGGTGNWSSANWSSSPSPPFPDNDADSNYDAIIDSDTVTLDTVTLTSDITISGLTLDENLLGDHTLTVNGPLHWSGGRLSATVIAAGGSITSGGSSRFLDGELINTGTLKWLEGNLSSSGGSAGILRNQAALNITGNSDRLTGQTGLILINEAGGTITKSDSAGVTLNSSFENDGDVNVMGGTLVVRSGSGDGSDGDFTVSSGAKLKFQPFPTHTIRGNVDGAGEVSFVGGTTKLQRQCYVGQRIRRRDGSG